MKPQAVRLADVFIIGPAMIVGGRELQRSKRDGLGTALIMMGIGTVLYNGANYLRTRTVEKAFSLDL